MHEQYYEAWSVFSPQRATNRIHNNKWTTAFFLGIRWCFSEIERTFVLVFLRYFSVLTKTAAPPPVGRGIYCVGFFPPYLA